MSVLALRRGTDLSDIADLRLRLANMRTELISQLAAEPILDSGLLALLGSIGAALAALDDRAAVAPSWPSELLSVMTGRQLGWRSTPAVRLSQRPSLSRAMPL